MKIKIGRTGKYALVDSVDYERVSQYQWWITKEGAAYTRISLDGITKNVYMHRFITNAPKDMVVDHKDHNRLNNQRNNIRVCTQADNCKNMPKRSLTRLYKGVELVRGKYWQTRISGKYIGAFKTAIEAARAYNKAALELHGEFAYLNDIEE
jgi:hypothetical protein